MFKMAISLRFIDIINKLGHLLRQQFRQKHQFYLNVAFVMYKHHVKIFCIRFYLYTNLFLKIYYSSIHFYSY